MRKFIVGNWKMNGTSADLDEIAAISALAQLYPSVDSALCLPATLVERAAKVVGDFMIGGQDCHMQTAGAYTGCISADMLLDAGAALTILGHSERRAAQHERDGDIRAKAETAHAAGLQVIVCVGETLEEREAGKALEIVLGQVAHSVPDAAAGNWLSLAYEPVWAIGTGRVAEPADVADMHATIRAALGERFGAEGDNIRILYGGSMNGDNAKQLLAVPNVDGGLIGGASLTAAKFKPILAAAQASGE
jgi:triosephosphate isomerase (TIM)